MSRWHDNKEQRTSRRVELEIQMAHVEWATSKYPIYLSKNQKAPIYRTRRVAPTKFGSCQLHDVTQKVDAGIINSWTVPFLTPVLTTLLGDWPEAVDKKFWIYVKINQLKPLTCNINTNINNFKN